MKQFLKYLVLFITFGAIYFGLECLWKGYITHWSMFILAGFVGVLIGSINEYLPWDMPLMQQCTVGMLIATFCEGITGLIVNVWLQLNVWHYNLLPFFWGQCSIPFMCAWFFLSGVCILLDDWIRWKFFGEQEPWYK